MKSLISDQSKTDYLKQLKVILLGGEALEKSLVKELQTLTKAQIWNVYGPTETTVWVTNTPVTDETDISMPPVRSTKVMPVATTIRYALSLKRFKKVTVLWIWYSEHIISLNLRSF